MDFTAFSTKIFKSFSLDIISVGMFVVNFQSSNQRYLMFAIYFPFPLFKYTEVSVIFIVLIRLSYKFDWSSLDCYK